MQVPHYWKTQSLKDVRLVVVGDGTDELLALVQERDELPEDVFALIDRWSYWMMEWLYLSMMTELLLGVREFPSHWPHGL